MPRATIQLLLALSLVLPSCAMSVDLPDTFLEQRADGRQFKASSADGAIFWIERFELPKKGDKLDFWVEALQNDLVGRRGYTAEQEPAAIKLGSRDAVEMLFHTTHQGRPHRYLVVLCVDKGWSQPSITVARYAAEKVVFDAHLEEVRTAIRSLRY